MYNNVFKKYIVITSSTLYQLMIDYVISAIFKLKVLFGVSIKVCKILICSAKIQRLVPQKSNGCKCIVKTILFVYTKSLSGQSWYVGWIVGFVVTCCSTWRTRLHADSEEFTSTVSRQWRCFTLQGRKDHIERLL